MRKTAVRVNSKLTAIKRHRPALRDLARRRRSGRLRKDPTQTAGILRLWVAEIRKRFGLLKQQITEQVVKKDVFGLTPGVLLVLEVDTAGKIVLRPREFQYTTDAFKVEQFMEWVNQQVDEGILDVHTRGMAAAVPGSPEGAPYWHNRYLRACYDKGVKSTATEVASIGITLPRTGIGFDLRGPVHAPRVEALYTRAYNELKGITDAMSQQIGRELAQGLVEGRNPHDIAKTLNERVDKIGITRARLLARTETAYARNMGAIYEMDRLQGIIGEEIYVQWETAGDSVVRPTHQERRGRVFTREEAKQLIGEPNCRCNLVPYIKSEQGAIDPKTRIPIDSKEQMSAIPGIEVVKEGKTTTAVPVADLTKSAPKMLQSFMKKWGLDNDIKFVDAVKTTGGEVADYPASLNPATGKVYISREFERALSGKVKIEMSKLGLESSSLIEVSPASVPIHELAHFIDGGTARTFSGSEAFRSIYRKRINKLLLGEETDRALSHLAYTSEAEFFAEGLAMYTMNPSWLSATDPYLYKFFGKVKKQWLSKSLVAETIEKVTAPGIPTPPIVPPAGLTNYQKKALATVATHANKAKPDFYERFKRQPALQSQVREAELAMSLDIKNGKLSICMNRQIRADSRSYADVLENGRFKNQFELGRNATSSGSLAPYKEGARDHWERTIFDGSYQRDHPVYNGLQRDDFFPTDLAQERPIYGYLNDPERLHIEGSYGRVTFELKPEVHKRTTFTMGNSSGVSSAGLRGGEVFDADHPYMIAHQWALNGNQPGWKGFSRFESYIEAQIHGGVSLDDVKVIYVPKESGYEHIFELGRKWGVPVKVRSK